MRFPVSVVVAVPRRPAGEQRFLLRRAIDSVQAQTLQPLEIIVVLDGPNASVCRELFKMDIPDLHILMQEGQTSRLNAWQTGIQAAQGDWIALIRDEDEWQPEKLAEQRQLAQHSEHSLPVVSCRFTMVSEAGEEVWPRRSPQTDEPLSDYLFQRKSGFLGEGMIHPSTLLFPRSLARAIPFRLPIVPPLPGEAESDAAEEIPVVAAKPLPQQDDERGWLLRIAAHPGVGFEFLMNSRSTSRWKRFGLGPCRKAAKPTWQDSLRWIQQHRAHLSDLAYQTFILTEVAAQAAESEDRQAFKQLLQEACQVGLPSPRLLFTYLSLWLMKPNQRLHLRSRVYARQNRVAAQLPSTPALSPALSPSPRRLADAAPSRGLGSAAITGATELGGALSQQVNGVA